MLQVFSSSCAFILVVRFIVFPYNLCLTLVSMATTMVLSILLLTTVPTFVLRIPLVTSANCYSSFSIKPLGPLTLFLEEWFNSSNILFDFTDSHWVIQLSGC